MMVYLLVFINCSIKAKRLTYEKVDIYYCFTNLSPKSYYSSIHIKHHTVQDEVLQTHRLASLLVGNSRWADLFLTVCDSTIHILQQCYLQEVWSDLSDTQNYLGKSDCANSSKSAFRLTHQGWEGGFWLQKLSVDCFFPKDRTQSSVY